MLSSLLSQYGIWLLVISGVLAGFAIVKAIRAGMRSRSAAYYALRQEAISRLRHWALIATLTSVVTIALAVTINTLPPQTIASVNTPTSAPMGPSATACPITSPIPSATATPASTATSTPTPSPTPTRTPVPTVTIQPGTVPNQLLTPIPSAVPPAVNAKFTLTTLASVTDNKGNPVDAGILFPQGTRSIKVFFRANNVNDGAVWSVFCYKGNRLVDNFVGLWKWGPRPQGGRAFCSIDGSVGTYKAAAYLGTAKQFEIFFNVIVPPTPTPTIAPTSTAPP